ncbi:OLC1v1020469C1 [Oldenlandia corymbosa var. corymbosa]|uniref:OLC1v1020469C1 n=1 Tax=Oldenlandia corymbosa var. corymbosa TaxID=529605 RepID=A0AAV1EGI5_OLDCO|nr:OLC1v1020469C1 [Oldenlandia corymbosa var. corymbosa]
MVMEVVQEDMGDGSMQCTDHPYKNSTPGGICAFCLQEKLGKLVSSSFPVAVFPSSSSSSSSPPSLRSEFGHGGLGGSMINPSSSSSSSSASALALRPSHHNVSSSSSTSFNHVVGGNRINDCDFSTSTNGQYYSRRSKMPFLLSQRRKKKKDYNHHAAMGMGVTSSDATSTTSSIVFKRSKSTTTPRRIGGIHNFLDEEEEDAYANDAADDYSPHKNKGFWSFLYSSKHSASKKGSTNQREFISYPSSLSSASGIGIGVGSVNGGTSMRSRDNKKREELVVVDENESPDQAELDRKVSRSRSVGCGSRSFSGDFFERISTGFGDCTLRRVESQREGNKPKLSSMHRNSTGQDCIKERVKCGGIFGGFMITSSSASSSSSSSYWVSSSAEDNKSVSTPGGHNVRHLAHGRSRSWGWALASPMRAFSKPSSQGKRESSSKNSTPNLSAIPSLLTVGG